MMMARPTHRLLLAAVFGGLALASPLCPGAVPGAWETFDTQANADAWELFDDSDGEFYPAEWQNTDGGDAYIGAEHIGDFPLTFVAGPEVGQGAFEGDYNAANVEAIACDIFIDNLDEFESVECSVTADGPAGRRIYYSLPYLKEDFDGDGWWTVDFSFDLDWYYLEDDEWTAVVVDEGFLANIGDVGIGFFPEIGSEANSFAAIDNVVLEPRVTAPELVTETLDDTFRMTFTPAPGLSAAVERLGPAPDFEWNDVVENVLGPAPYQFFSPVDARSKIFRVRTEPV